MKNRKNKENNLPLLTFSNNSNNNNNNDENNNNDNDEDNNNNIQDPSFSPTITSSLISLDEKLNYNTIKFQNNNNSNINNNNNNTTTTTTTTGRKNENKLNDNLFSLFYNQSVLYQNYLYTNCRILIITGEKDVTRVTFDELLLIIKEIRNFDINLSNTSNNTTSPTPPTPPSSTDNDKVNLIVNDYFNNLDKCFWIDIYGLHDDEIILFTKSLNIHHLNVDDILSNDSNEKCESHENYFFIATSEMGSNNNSSKYENESLNNTGIGGNGIGGGGGGYGSNSGSGSVRGGGGGGGGGFQQQKELKENFFYLFLFKRIIFVLHSTELDSFTDVFKSFRYLKNVNKTLTSTEWVLCNFMESITDLISLENDKMMEEVELLDEMCTKDQDENDDDFYYNGIGGDINDDYDNINYISSSSKYNFRNYNNNNNNNNSNNKRNNDSGGSGGGGGLDYTKLYIRIGKASRRNTNLLSNLFNKDVLFSSLSRQQFSSNETKLFLNHINNKSKRLKDRIKLCEELLEGVHTTYINKVSLVLNEESHSLTVSMKKFADYSMIAMILNYIASLFGMNVLLPGQANEDNPSDYIAFFIIIFVMCSLAIVLTLLFKKIKWF